MSKIASFSEMLKFHFGSKIICPDGEDGLLTYIIFDLATHKVTHIGIKQRRLFGSTVFLPFDTVVSATGEGLKIRASRAELAAGESKLVGGVILDEKSMVENTVSSRRGRLMLVAVHAEDGELAYLAVHGLRQGQDTLLKSENVIDIATGYIRVQVEGETLNGLPTYRPDNVLQREVEEVLNEKIPLHIDLKGISARVLDGVLYLDGNISSSLRGDLAEREAMGVSGVLEIKNRLVGDDMLASELAMALGRDPRTRDLPIGVYPRLGVVRLSGAVHNGQQKAAAEEIARNFEGVRSVLNDLVLDPKADLLYVMSSAEGGESEDKVPGKYIRHTK
ncbi:MAG TPA: BON domain-containing protein [Ktedonobacteraceae bacterium]|nr:BON domain-containing protein [Ktedonobacteraceae bacterium]